MRERMYRLLVTRVPGIQDRYQNRRRREGGKTGISDLFYLLGLNGAYYLFAQKKLAFPEERGTWEEISLPPDQSESEGAKREEPETLAKRLASYTILSFDVFDTLLFRLFSHPADVFYLVGQQLGYPDFRRIRMEMEEKARERKQKAAGTREVTFEEIWEVMEEETGIPREEGMEAEWEWERRCCVPNPYMLRVVKELSRLGKTPVILSDMYLDSGRIRRLLQDCGYGTFRDIYVSGEMGASKSEGSLFRRIREIYGPECTYVHVGDQERSDVRQARNQGWEAVWYENVNQAGNRYRPFDLSPITGSLYRGLVNARLYGGLSVYSREYEYGYLYGGLFVTGYCRFLHSCVKARRIDRILFLSRDGDLLCKVYRKLYPGEEEKLRYGYWSRLAAVKVTAEYFKYDYFRRFLFHKADQGLELEKILDSMELTFLLADLCREEGLTPDTKLTHRNAENVKKYLIGSWDRVLAHYQEQVEAGGVYYRELLGGAKRAAAVDIGWAGSGAVMLDYAVNHLWNLDCEITGILAGTNSFHSPEADASEPLLASGKLVSYLYSQQENRDLWRLHDAARGHNLFWELLLGAEEGSLRGFYPGEDGGYVLQFKEPGTDGKKIREIHRGILDFTDQFLEAERRLGKEIRISGRDAYAPMVSIGSPKNKRFMEKLEGLMDEIHIG